MSNKLAMDMLARLNPALAAEYTAAHAAEVCVDCKERFTAANVQSPAGWRETRISGMCENCWNALFAEGDA